ncbi:MAG TPA: hypothetical protein PK048_01695 [Candidatus Absconditabacterales bacterium]|nr:hypothetical protein [Candidatus Absconditabacterales bacterium]
MILLAHKPSGRTSHDVVQHIKYITRSKKCGHAGTLDPMASGLMILATDADTPKLHGLVGHDKSYRAIIDLSVMSDTWDYEYRSHWIEYSYTLSDITIDSIVKPRPHISDIQHYLNELVQNQKPELPVPPFSAKKVSGKTRYENARKGIMDIVYQPMSIYDIQIIGYEPPLLTIDCHVGSGTYIRSIAYRLGQKLGIGGVLKSLVRTNIGEYNLGQVAETPVGSKIAFVEISVL